MEADLRRYKLFSVPLFLIGSMLIGVAAYVHLAIFDYAHCFGVSGLIAAVNGFIAFGAIYLVLGLFCCCYPGRIDFEFGPDTVETGYKVAICPRQKYLCI